MSAVVKVAGFAAGLAAVLGVSWAAGAAVGPVVDAPEPMVHADGGTEMDHDESLPGGLAVAQAGYRLVLDQDVLRSGARQVGFTIVGADGEPVTAYDVEHEKQLHLIAVRRDFRGFQHVHPVLDEATGEWTTDVDLTPGSWRVFADFSPEGGDPLTLGADLSVPGVAARPGSTPIRRTDTVDGYRVTVDGDLTSGEHSMLDLTVTQDGEPVTDLEPYLGAYGHLVALREGDLAFLHVHPGGEPGDGLTEAGPVVEFGAEVPSPGRYHLYLDFKRGGVVRTADFVLEAS